MLISLTVEKFEGIIEKTISKSLSKLKEMNEKKENNQEVDKMLTRTETASYFGISLVTLNKWAKLGILNPIKMEGKVMYSLLELKSIKKKL